MWSCRSACGALARETPVRALPAQAGGPGVLPGRGVRYGADALRCCRQTSWVWRHRKAQISEKDRCQRGGCMCTVPLPPQKRQAGLDVAQRWRESMSLRHNSNKENGMSHR